MSHELDFSTGKAAIAYAGDTPWHHYGKRKPDGTDWTLAQWIAAASCNYDVVRVPAYAQMPDGSFVDAGTYFNSRSDTKALLGGQTHTDRRVEVQPAEIFQFIWDIVALDPRYAMEVIGALFGGAQVWATARFTDVSGAALSIAGEQHQAFLLARTGFDGSLATHFQYTLVRGVCNNTVSAAFLDKRALFTLRHTKKLDVAEVKRRLSEMAASVDTFKAAGEALAQNVMAENEVVDLFRHLLDIPAQATSKDISTRKNNQFNQLVHAYDISRNERGGDMSAWTALQSVTRYVDHDRSGRGDDSMSPEQKRFVSSQFGSGAELKGKAMAFLMPRIKDKILIPA